MRSVFLAATVSLCVMAVSGDSAVYDRYGLLAPATLAGNNPATGQPWEPGDQYRLAFQSSERRTAFATNVTEYNVWIQGLADASTKYNISAAAGVTWKVIGSTDHVDARYNTGTNPDVNGDGCTIYLLDGSTVVANNYVDLWDGAIQHIIDLMEDGVVGPHWPFTGSYSDGTRSSDHGASFSALGGGGQIQQGNASVVSDWVWRQWTGDPPETLLPMYGLSDPLTLTGGSGHPGTVLLVR